MLLTRCLKDRGEGLARPTPFGPEIDEHDSVGKDGFFEEVLGDVDGAHEGPFSAPGDAMDSRVRTR